jgi:hypothetical protein
MNYIDPKKGFYPVFKNAVYGQFGIFHRLISIGPYAIPTPLLIIKNESNSKGL